VGHIVVFEGSDRVPTYHRCEELGDAVSFVEKLRNDRGIESAQIFRTEEVRFDFRPYYRVELGFAPAIESQSTTPEPLPLHEPEPDLQPVDVPAMAPAPPPISSLAPAPSEPPYPHNGPVGEYGDDGDVSVGTGVRRGLFGR
jgi:hypothetical protein